MTPKRLIAAYQQGIFPWYNEGDPIMWWSPDPRAVLFLDQLKISRSLNKIICKEIFQITFDQNFATVIRQCAEMRKTTIGTWISEEMIEAYCALHYQGFAHSVEVWQQDQIVGGLYGVTVGKIFCGESMFSKVSNASKVALVHLVERLKQQDFLLIDCQMPTKHLMSLGATTIPREEFLKLLNLNLSTNYYLPFG